MQDLNDMLYFAEVVSQGSFAAAGRTLGVPKSRLSRRVARLEERLGTRLLQRTTRKLSLTTAGEIYYRHCSAMRDEAESADAAIAQVQSEPRGVIRVVCPVTLAQTVVAEILPDYIRRYPQVQVHMEVNNRVVDLVEEGVDVALRVRASLAESGSLVVKQLGSSKLLLVASPGLLQEYGRPQEPDDILRFPTVAMSASGGRTPWTLWGPHGRQHVVTHSPHLVADDLLTLKLAVLGGSGIGLLADYLCRDELADGRMELALPGWAPPPGIVHAVFGSRRGLTPAVRSFLDFLGEHLGPESSSGA